jgi:hypothetical protein
VLGALKIEKSAMFSGYCLVKDEDGLANGDPDVEMLENSNTSERFGWLQRCAQLAGEDGMLSR